VTLFGIVMLVKLLQPPNAQSPMLVIPLPKVILVNPVQPENAFLSMLVTLFGIVMEVKLLQPPNAESPMLMIPLPKVILVNPVQPLNV